MITLIAATLSLILGVGSLIYLRNGNPSYTPFSDTSHLTVRINTTTFIAEAAVSPLKKEQGLSGRETLGENEGMLFIFSKPQSPGFWMKGMKLPLDFIWIQGASVIGITPNIAADSQEILTPPSPANIILEIPAGAAEKNSIRIGDTVIIEEIH